MIIGRERERADLEHLIASDKSEFVAVYGRRRIGKTFLIRETCRYQFAFEHTGLKNTLPDENGHDVAVKDATKRQLSEFAVSLRRHGRVKKSVPKDWFAAFHLLEDLLEGKPEGRKIVFLDECPWMDTPRSDFLAALDHFWNGWCTMRKDILLIICGSAASWVLNKIDNDVGGLHNRLSRHIYLRPFRLHECEEFARAKGVVMNRMQLLECYMILGGVPYYWDLLHSDLGMAQNIDALLFAPGAELRREYGHLYASLFRNPDPYVAIIRALSRKKCGMTRDEVIRQSGVPGNGKLTEMLKVLEQCDFIRAYSVPGNRKKDRVFQLVDNFTLYYFRFIEGEDNPPADYWRTFSATQEASVWRGLAFERVALLHVDQIKRKLGISGVITRQYAWRRRASDEGDEGAQIDLVIERNDAVTNLCEMKCTSEPFEISDAYDAKLRGRREAFLSETGTKNAVHLTIVSANGLKRNANAFDVQSVVTLDDLFQA